MTMLKKLVGTAGKLKSGLKREFEYLSHVLQALIFITIIDEFCYVKLSNKRELMRSIISRSR
jgi:hypothetical protein